MPMRHLSLDEIREIHILQSENVRHLAGVLLSINRDINRLIARNDDRQIQISTKILALVYSAWSEAQFLQILYTPHGLSYEEISSIKLVQKNRGIVAAWQLMLNRAILRANNCCSDQNFPDRLTMLETVVENYIKEPSQIRNKIAHGQWINALNSRNTDKDDNMSLELSRLDPVLIMSRMKIHQCFGYIVRDLMQSPTRGFHQNYRNNNEKLEMFIAKSENWNLDSKKVKIAKKGRKGTSRLGEMKDCMDA